MGVAVVGASVDACVVGIASVVGTTSVFGTLCVTELTSSAWICWPTDTRPTRAVATAPFVNFLDIICRFLLGF